MFKSNIVDSYRRKYKYRYHNFCKKYHLEDILEEESFNKRFGDIKVMWALTKRNSNKTKKLLRSIEQRIENNSNVIIVIYGTPNSGKSEAAQTLALYWKSKFYLITKKKCKIFIGTSTASFTNILTEMNKGDISIRDESPKLSGAGSVNVQKYLDNITKLIRAEQNSFIFIDPLKIEADVVSYYLESAGKCISERKTRFILYDKDGKLMGRVYLPLHYNSRLRREYKREKAKNIVSVRSNAGMVTPEIDGKKLKQDIKILFTVSKKYGVSNKGEIHGLIPLYNSEIKDDNKKIKGDTNYMKVLISNVWRIIKKKEFDTKLKEKIEKKEEPELEIRYEDGYSFASFCRNNIPNVKMAKVAEGLAMGYSYRTIVDNTETDGKDKIGSGVIQIITQKLRSVNNKYNIGFMFERWFALKVGVPLEKLEETVACNSMKPDLIWNDKIYSLKFRFDSKSSSLTFSQSKDFRPEYEYAKKMGKTYEFVIMNPKWGQDVLMLTIDPIKDPDRITVKKPKPEMKKLIM